jgi:hypothetical protein
MRGERKGRGRRRGCIWLLYAEDMVESSLADSLTMVLEYLDILGVLREDRWKN